MLWARNCGVWAGASCPCRSTNPSGFDRRAATTVPEPIDAGRTRVRSRAVVSEQAARGGPTGQLVPRGQLELAEHVRHVRLDRLDRDEQLRGHLAVGVPAGDQPHHLALPRLAGFVLDAFGAAAGDIATGDDELDRLSAREREVMRLIARGYSYREVASELFISIKTVETHVSAVLRKLQLSSRHELTRWAAARRLL